MSTVSNRGGARLLRNECINHHMSLLPVSHPLAMICVDKTTVLVAIMHNLSISKMEIWYEWHGREVHISRHLERGPFVTDVR